MKKNITNSARETQKIAKEIAKKILEQKPKKKAVVLALQGDLGAGKTTFVQGLAKGLGIKGKILSPTFNILKKFKMNKAGFKHFYHIDCYRLDGKKDLEVLGFKEMLVNPENIVALEWPEKVKSILPKNTLTVTFKHLTQTTREIVF